MLGPQAPQYAARSVPTLSQGAPAGSSWKRGRVEAPLTSPIEMPPAQNLPLVSRVTGHRTEGCYLTRASDSQGQYVIIRTQTKRIARNGRVAR